MSVAAQQTEASAMVNGVYQTYAERLAEVQAEYNQLQHKLSRANHEMNRLQRHIDRVTAFCTDKNITLEKGKE